MFNIVLFQPEIPPNTGNIIRLCANTGCTLHLIRPLGFDLDDKKLRRAGLDYHEWATVKHYDDMQALRAEIARTSPGSTEYAVSTRGKTTYSDADFRHGDCLVFGPETRGLPADYLQAMPPHCVLRLPMRPDSRSLNLSNTVSTVVYEALKQQDFAGLV